MATTSSIWDMPNDKYEAKIDELRSKLDSLGHTIGSTEWMAALIRLWFGFETPREWQIECCSKLVHGTDVLLMAPTGSGKSITILAPVIARRVLKRPCIGIAIYPTCSLMADQVCGSLSCVSGRVDITY